MPCARATVSKGVFVEGGERTDHLYGFVVPIRTPYMTLTGTLDVRRDEDRVAFVFAVENEGSEPTTLSFRDSCTADFAVLDGENERWRWSQGRMFTQALQSEELAPGETATYEGEWQRPEAGTHIVVATLEAENHDCEARTEISV